MITKENQRGDPKVKKVLAEYEKLLMMEESAVVDTPSKYRLQKAEKDNSTYKVRKMKNSSKLKQAFLGILAGLMFMTPSASAGQSLLDGFKATSSMSQSVERKTELGKAAKTYENTMKALTSRGVQGLHGGSTLSSAIKQGGNFWMFAPTFNFARVLITAEAVGMNAGDIQQLADTFVDNMAQQERLGLSSLNRSAGENNSVKEYNKQIQTEIAQTLMEDARDIGRMGGLGSLLTQTQMLDAIAAQHAKTPNELPGYAPVVKVAQKTQKTQKTQTVKYDLAQQSSVKVKDLSQLKVEDIYKIAEKGSLYIQIASAKSGRPVDKSVRDNLAKLGFKTDQISKQETGNGWSKIMIRWSKSDATTKSKLNWVKTNIASDAMLVKIK